MAQKWLILAFFVTSAAFSQETVKPDFDLDVQYYYGTLIRHNKNISHLVRNHPVGYLIGYNHKTYGEKHWQQAYNYPDWGISFLYQDFKYEPLGENYGLYGHYNFFFLKRHLMLRSALGLAYNTNPFDFDTNFKNIAYGNHILVSAYLLLGYRYENLFSNLDIHAGISYVHHSNGSFKAPNSGTNVVGLNVGLHYSVDNRSGEPRVFIEDSGEKDYSENIKFNFLIRSGINESDYFNLGQHAFWVFSAYADKRLNDKSTLQFGAEYFISNFLKKEIEYVSTSFVNRVDPDTDYKRASVMLGHELRLGSVAVPTQIGYYFYWPYAYESRVYGRIGIKYYITEAVFGVATVKAHAANAECIEFGLGIRI